MRCENNDRLGTMHTCDHRIYRVTWTHSSCHGTYAEDALLANAKPGGKQAKLRDTVKSYSMLVFLIQVLKRYRNGMKLDEMRAEISGHPDFKNEKT